MPRILAIGVIAAVLLSSASAQSKCFNVAAGYTYKNMQYNKVNATDPADCCTKCQAYTGFGPKTKCTFWTFTTDGNDKNICWVKSNNKGYRKAKGATSGSVNDVPLPTPPPTPPPTPKPPTPPPTPKAPTPPPTPWDGKPVQVFIMMGQSNMLGEGRIMGDTNGTLEYACKTEHKYPYLLNKDGSWATREGVRNVFIMQSGNHTGKVQQNEWMTADGARKTIGPELGIGNFLANYTDTTDNKHVMLLKSCIGDRALGWDLLPPGSNSFDFDVTEKNGSKVTYTYAGYHQSPMKWIKGTQPKPIGWEAGEQWDGDTASAAAVLKNISTFYPGANKYKVAGFFWWQGDKDSRDMGLSTQYETNLVNFIKTIRKTFDAPNAPFVTASLGQTVKGDTGGDGLILDAMLNVDGKSGKYPDFKGNVAAVYTHPLSMGSSSGAHYGKNAETYMNVGQAMGSAMVTLLKGAQ